MHSNNNDFSQPCRFCPRQCMVVRSSGEKGYCNLDEKLYVSSVCIHTGEEPPVSGEKGICNVFFSHCNLSCIYCQNFQISNNNKIYPVASDYQKTVEQIVYCLEKGASGLGFVSPSHQIPQMVSLIDKVRSLGFNPTIVYNTNGYDDPGTLKTIEDYVDVYLVDFKYSDSSVAKELSDVSDYPEIALKAIQEMIRQKGVSLTYSTEGLAKQGVIIRHLVLPGYIDNSIGVMNMIADFLDPKIALSLMSQYYPAGGALKHDKLNRTLKVEEYQRVVDYIEFLGFDNGWIQEMDSKNNYQPDFDKETPFE